MKRNTYPYCGRLFAFQTSAINTTLESLEGKAGSFAKFPLGSLDRTYGVTLIDPKEFIYCVCSLDKDVKAPQGFEEFSYSKLIKRNRDFGARIEWAVEQLHSLANEQIHRSNGADFAEIDAEDLEEVVDVLTGCSSKKETYQEWIASELAALGMKNVVCPHCGNANQNLMAENWHFTHAHHQALNYQCHNYSKCDKYFQIGPISRCPCGWSKKEAEIQIRAGKVWTFDFSNDSWDWRVKTI